MLGAIGDALGLGGDAPKGPPPEPAKFTRGDILDSGGGEDKGSLGGGGVENALDAGEVVEFIHFGHVHPDWHTNFQHAGLDDTQCADLGDQKAHGIMFRAALLRETLLINGYMAACQRMLREYKDGKGSLGDIMNAASALLGGGGAPAGPDPAKLDDYLSRVGAAGGSINKSPINYPEVHKAGVDLHQTRSEYTAYVSSLEPDTSSGLLPSMPGPLGTVQAIAFKAQEIYLQMYLSTREHSEPVIASTCYEFSLACIRQRSVPIFPIWSPVDKPPEQKKDDDSDNLLKPVNDAVNDAMAKVNEMKQKVEDFLGLSDAAEAPGSPYLAAAFAGLEQAPAWMCDSFKSVVGELPGILATLVKEITEANLKLLKAVYTHLLMKPGEPIDDELLLAAGRDVITRRMFTLLGSAVPGADLLQGGQGWGGVAGKFAGDRLASFLDDDVIVHIDFIVQEAVSGLNASINDTRSTAGSGEPPTMEVFLGRLPWWLSQMTKNVVFPVWDLVINGIFGSITGVAGGFISSVSSALGTAKSAVGDAKKAYDKISNPGTTSLGVGDIGKVGDALKDPGGTLKNALFGSGDDAAPPPAFPGGADVAREKTGTGNEIDEGQIVAAEHKWDTAQSGPSPDEAAAQAPPQADQAAA